MLRLLTNTPEKSPQLALIESYVPPRRIEPGEFIYVYDGVKDAWLWQLVAEVRTENERQLIRVDRADFFIDETLIAAVAYLTGGGI